MSSNDPLPRADGRATITSAVVQEHNGGVLQQRRASDRQFSPDVLGIVHSHWVIPSRLASASTRASVLPCGGRKHVGRVPAPRKIGQQHGIGLPSIIAASIARADTVPLVGITVRRGAPSRRSSGRTGTAQQSDCLA